MTPNVPLKITYNGVVLDNVYLTVIGIAIESVEIATPAEKTEYLVGEKIDLTGLSFFVTYNNGTSETVTDLSGCIVDGEIVAGDVVITVIYEGFEFTYTVFARDVDFAFISQDIIKTEYLIGEKLDPEGLLLYVVYTDGTEEEIAEGFEIVCDDFTAAGEYVVTVSYGSFTDTFTVTVTEPAPEEPENIAEGTIDGTDIAWVIDAEGTLTVSGTGAIPNYTRSATAPWTSYSKQVKKIVVADGITVIGECAFYNLQKATSIELPETVKELRLQFIRGTGVTEITLPAVERIREQAFARADSLKVINAGESVKDIWGTILFSENVTIKAPANSYIAKYAETYAEYFTVSASITFEAVGTAKAPINYFGKAGDKCFYAVYQKSSTNWAYEISGDGRMKNFPYVSDKGAALGYTFTPTYYMGGNERNIQSVVVYDGVTTLGNYLFYKCTKVSSIDVQGDITSIGRGVFQACARLKSFTVPASVTKIERNAFNGCQALTDVYIPAGIETFEEGMFVKCNTAGLTVHTTSQVVIDVLTAEYPEITIVAE
jgi:hypothetical protein